MGNDNQYSFIQGRITIANPGIQPSSPLIHTTPSIVSFSHTLTTHCTHTSMGMLVYMTSITQLHTD
jgi:hypothetical protein